jgi:hypothetical protein
MRNLTFGCTAFVAGAQHLTPAAGAYVRLLDGRSLCADDPGIEVPVNPRMAHEERHSFECATR